MSNNEITNLEAKINMIQKYEEMAKDATEKANELKDEVKELMKEKQTDEIVTPNFIVRFIDILTTRFDTKRFKEELGEELYNSYTKQVASRRFTIA